MILSTASDDEFFRKKISEIMASSRSNPQKVHAIEEIFHQVAHDIIRKQSKACEKYVIALVKEKEIPEKGTSEYELFVESKSEEFEGLLAEQRHELQNFFASSQALVNVPPIATNHFIEKLINGRRDHFNIPNTISQLHDDLQS